MYHVLVGRCGLKIAYSARVRPSELVAKPLSYLVDHQRTMLKSSVLVTVLLCLVSTLMSVQSQGELDTVIMVSLTSTYVAAKHALCARRTVW